MSDNSDTRSDTMDDCMAALLLMRLSCSPKSARLLESDSGVWTPLVLPLLQSSVLSLRGLERVRNAGVAGRRERRAQKLLVRKGDPSRGYFERRGQC